MIKPLRKRHLQVWSVLLVLLPAGIIFSWLVIPNQSPIKLLQPETTDLLPIIKKTSDKKDYTINLRSNPENTQWQLEWKNKTVLTVPSAVIYKVFPSRPGGTSGGALESFRPEDAILIGRIEAKGDYVFQLKSDSTRHNELKLVLYDFIHQKIIEYINF